MLISLVFVVAVLAIFSDTGVGRNLRESLSRWRFPQPTLGRVVLVVLLLVLATALVVFLKTDGLAVGAQSLPYGMEWFAAFDVACYLDVVTLAAIAALAMRTRGVSALFRSAAARCARWVRAILQRRSGRTPRSTRVRAARKSHEDDPRVFSALFA